MKLSKNQSQLLLGAAAVLLAGSLFFIKRPAETLPEESDTLESSAVSSEAPSPAPSVPPSEPTPKDELYYKGVEIPFPEEMNSYNFNSMVDSYPYLYEPADPTILTEEEQKAKILQMLCDIRDVKPEALSHISLYMDDHSISPYPFVFQLALENSDFADFLREIGSETEIEILDYISDPSELTSGTKAHLGAVECKITTPFVQPAMLRAAQGVESTELRFFADGILQKMKKIDLRSLPKTTDRALLKVVFQQDEPILMSFLMSDCLDFGQYVTLPLHGELAYDEIRGRDLVTSSLIPLHSEMTEKEFSAYPQTKLFMKDLKKSLESLKSEESIQEAIDGLFLPSTPEHLENIRKAVRSCEIEYQYLASFQEGDTKRRHPSLLVHLTVSRTDPTLGAPGRQVFHVPIYTSRSKQELSDLDKQNIESLRSNVMDFLTNVDTVDTSDTRF